MIEEEKSWALLEQSQKEVTHAPLALVLKRRREEKGMSLQATAAATRIPIRYLQHLEGGGAAHLLSDELYLVPFLRTYATFLDLDPSPVVVEFISDLHRQEAPEGRARKTPPPRSLFRPLVFLLILAGLGLLVSLWTSIQQG